MTNTPDCIAAIVLAAGQSVRMGEKNKLLEPLDGTPMIRRIVDQVCASKAATVIVVVGFQADQTRDALAGCDVVFTVNEHYKDGLSTSLRCGLEKLPDEINGVMICLGDMPHLQADHLDQMIDTFREHQGDKICVPVFQGKQGNPVLWPRRYIAEMTKLIGDVGAKSLIRKYHDHVYEVAMTDDGTQFDIDTPEALKRLESQQ